MKHTAIVTNSDQETARLGTCIATVLRPGMVLALEGDLGTGKTVLTRGIARGLGITEPVTSPTFTIVQEYAVTERLALQRPEPLASLWLFHLDMYRIESEDDALAFGIEEFLFVPDGIAVIEWPERIAGLLKVDADVTDADGALRADSIPALLTIRLEHVGESQRRILLPAWLNTVPGIAGS